MPITSLTGLRRRGYRTKGGFDPADFVDLLLQAIELRERKGLGEPLGRVAYVLNRRCNTWPMIRSGESATWPGRWVYRNKTPAEVMASMRLATAQRWGAHWLAGGAIKRHGIEEGAYRKLATASAQRARTRRLSEGARFRLEVKRAQRAAKKAGISEEK
jgi:hypothetical protein